MGLIIGIEVLVNVKYMRLFIFCLYSFWSLLFLVALICIYSHANLPISYLLKHVVFLQLEKNLFEAVCFGICC